MPSFVPKSLSAVLKHRGEERVRGYLIEEEMDRNINSNKRRRGDYGRGSNEGVPEKGSAACSEALCEQHDIPAVGVPGILVKHVCLPRLNSLWTVHLFF